MKSWNIMSRLAGALSAIGAVAILIILVVTVADVVMNKIFNSPFPGATEIITSMMPISVFGFLLSTQIKERHITIDAVTVRLTAKWQAFVKSIGLGIGVYLFGLLTYLNIPMAIHSFKIGDHTGGMVAVPLYPAKIIIPVATGLVAIQLLIELSRSISTLLAKQSVNSAPVNSDDIK